MIAEFTAELERALEGAVLAVLETMFFTSVDHAATSDLPDALTMGVRFSGSLGGNFRLSLDRGTALALASTMLCASEEELTSEQAMLVVAELANMICGAFLSHIEPNAELTLDTPVQVIGGMSEPGSIESWFEMPEGLLGVSVRLDDSPGLVQ